jgi:hypothetical protein
MFFGMSIPDFVPLGTKSIFHFITASDSLWSWNANSFDQMIESLTFTRSVRLVFCAPLVIHTTIIKTLPKVLYRALLVPGPGKDNATTRTFANGLISAILQHARYFAAEAQPSRSRKSNELWAGKAVESSYEAVRETSTWWT